MTDGTLLVTRAPARPSDDQIGEAYKRLQSVWAVGRELGIAGQTVHKRMKKAGLVVNAIRTATDEELEQIRSYYTTTPPEQFDLQPLADRLGRLKSTVAMFANRMGLTIMGRPRNAEVRKRQGKTVSDKWKRIGHPRGALGMVHSAEAKEKMSAASKLTWATSKTFGVIHMSPEARDARSLRNSIRIAQQDTSKSHSRSAAGRRDDLGATWFRSSWEANYARYLNLLMKMKLVDSWAYEPETFWFEGIKRGVMSYKPDFRVIYRGDPKPEYIEIKGWQVAKDLTKWKRMAKYHPNIKLVVIAQKEYRQIENKWSSALPSWERRRIKSLGAA